MAEAVTFKTLVSREVKLVICLIFRLAGSCRRTVRNMCGDEVDPANCNSERSSTCCFARYHIKATPSR